MKRVTTTPEAQKLVHMMELQERAIRAMEDIANYLAEWEDATPETIEAFKVLKDAIFGGYSNEV